MAKFMPTLDWIAQNKKNPPTSGEWCLLKQLEKYLDDSHTVFFKPMLNGDFPDIVVFKQGYGVYIIEVKDWNLDNFEFEFIEKENKKSTFCEMYFYDKENKRNKILTPMQEVKNYKDNIINLYSEKLLHAKLLYKIQKAKEEKYHIKTHEKIR